ncbi:hypothetical protein [Streptomyces sp. CB03238]|uniref:hypothetical protein n=1 Tax=Streptomyces sp. CB03238 TaxID=1907777 RepID=UPI0011812CB0|nr:hypothetical protein [Streptomyces sp. CB03238]
MTLRKPLALATTLVFALLVGCAQEEPSSAGRSERETAEAYVAALNARDVEALVELGPPGYEETEQDARKVIATDGGRGLKLKDVRVSHEFGDDVASTQVIATDRDGKPFSTYVQMSRHNGTWVVAMGHAPGAGQDGKSSATTDRPK